MKDTTTGKEYDIPVSHDKKGNRVWVLKIEVDGKTKTYRFTDKNLEVQAARKKQEEYSAEVLSRRNNVEATMFLISQNTRNKKTRYRGIFRNKLAITTMSIWINFVRLTGCKKKPEASAAA